ncbi:MAG: hypothetical protein JWO13_836 [Acidobacteriales bacterium]|nr:hypothetical protein [Terriglobales bacterium]
MKKILLLITIVMMFCSAGTAQSVSIASTYNAVAFTNQATAAPTLAFRNISQSSHWLTYCPNANTTALAIELEASQDNTTWYAITAQGVIPGPGCTTLQAGGYYPYVRANLISISGASAAVSAYYGASIFPIAAGGVGSLGLSSVPVTYVGTATGGVGIACTQASIFSGPLVLYNLIVDNPSNATIYVLIADSGNGKTIAQFSVPTDKFQQIQLPAIGVQVTGDIIAEACTTRGHSGVPSAAPYLAVQYKVNPLISSQVSNAGTVTGTTPGRQ